MHFVIPVGETAVPKIEELPAVILFRQVAMSSEKN